MVLQTLMPKTLMKKKGHQAAQKQKKKKQLVLAELIKKGDITTCRSYIVEMLSTAYKILPYPQQRIAAPYAEVIIGKYQCGFIPGKSTIDQILTLRQVMAKSVNLNFPIHQLFTDLKPTMPT